VFQSISFTSLFFLEPATAVNLDDLRTVLILRSNLLKTPENLVLQSANILHILCIQRPNIEHPEILKPTNKNPKALSKFLNNPTHY